MEQHDLAVVPTQIISLGINLSCTDSEWLISDVSLCLDKAKRTRSIPHVLGLGLVKHSRVYMISFDIQV